MRLAVERLGPELDYLPDGETGDRRNWVISMIEALRAHPDFRVVKDGDWSDYDKTPRFASGQATGSTARRWTWASRPPSSGSAR